MRPRTKKQRQELGQALSTNTIKMRVGEWARNLVANERMIRAGKGANVLFETLKGVPAILVGAGPSLDKNIDMLAECKEYACILACDAALKPLLDKGIKPDIAVVVDSKPVVKTYLETVFDRSADLLLATDVFVHPSTVEGWEGEVYWFCIARIEHCPLTYATVEFAGQVGNLGSGGNVTTMMWCLTYGGLKCDPIILVGNDHAFYEEAHDHANGSPAVSFKGTYEALEVEDMYGEKCYTTSALLTFHDWFETMFIKSPGIHVNASEGGIITNGCLCMTLAEAKERFLTRKVAVPELLHSGPIIETADEKYRWGTFVAKDGELEREENGNFKTVPVSPSSTYLPASLVEYILETQGSKDLEEALAKVKQRESRENVASV